MQEFFRPLIHSALCSGGITTDKPIQIEQPADKKFGDFSTNIALLTARECKRNPRELAQIILPPQNKPFASMIYYT